tara:strand:+ start:5829 stop:6269 length:441 start_codon:yes stop_codon:yes gene_type:complete
MILNEIKSSLKSAMKDSNKSEVLAMRNILEKIKQYEVDKKTSVNENDILTIISKYVKQLRDSIDQFKKGNRLDLVEKEQNELEIILRFLPKQLDRNEVSQIIENTIKDLNASNLSDMGKVIGVVISQTKGQADGKMISEIVKEKLK